MAGCDMEVTSQSTAEGGVAGGGHKYRDRIVDLYQDLKQPWCKDVTDFEPMIRLSGPGFGARSGTNQ
jgi:hypothetical protein